MIVWARIVQPVRFQSRDEIATWDFQTDRRRGPDDARSFRWLEGHDQDVVTVGVAARLVVDNVIPGNASGPNQALARQAFVGDHVGRFKWPAGIGEKKVMTGRDGGTCPDDRLGNFMHRLDQWRGLRLHEVLTVGWVELGSFRQGRRRRAVAMSHEGES